MADGCGASCSVTPLRTGALPRPLMRQSTCCGGRWKAILARAGIVQPRWRAADTVRMVSGAGLLGRGLHRPESGHRHRCRRLRAAAAATPAPAVIPAGQRAAGASLRSRLAAALERNRQLADYLSQAGPVTAMPDRPGVNRNASASALAAQAWQYSRPSTASGPGTGSGGIPRLFSKCLRHVELACHRESVPEAECQLATSTMTVK